MEGNTIRHYINQIEQLQCEQDGIYHNVALKYGLSDIEMWLLYMLSDSENGCTQQEMCQQYHIPKQTINAAVSRFVKKGIARMEAISGTRNQKRILLTEMGEKLAADTIPNIMEAEFRAYGSMSAEEREIYLKLTRKITAAIKDEMSKL